MRVGISGTVLLFVRFMLAGRFVSELRIVAGKLFNFVLLSETFDQRR